MKVAELKFRIWVEEQKRFFYPKWKVSEEGVELEIVDDDDSNKLKNFNLDEQELELALSIKDKNGRELYENDVVLYDSNKYCIINKADEFFLANDESVKFLPGNGCSIELLGNIHEQ